MKVYFDTSAIAKYFHDESGAAQVIQMIDDPTNTVWISELAITEFISAFHRKFRMEEINLETLQNLLVAFESKVAAWNVEPFSTLQSCP